MIGVGGEIYGQRVKDHSETSTWSALHDTYLRATALPTEPPVKVALSLIPKPLIN